MATINHPLSCHPDAGGISVFIVAEWFGMRKRFTKNLHFLEIQFISGNRYLFYGIHHLKARKRLTFI